MAEVLGLTKRRVRQSLQRQRRGWGMSRDVRNGAIG